MSGAGTTVTFLGTGDVLHGAGMGHASLLVDDPRGRLLVDCGPTVPLALAKAGVSFESIDVVAVTHLHGDHFGGLPFLFLSALRAAKQASTPGDPVRPPLVVVGPPLVAQRVEALFRVLYERSSTKLRPFFLDYREVEPGQAVEAHGFRIEAAKAAHLTGDAATGGLALGYRIETSAGIVATSGDSAAHDGLEALADRAALFACECTFGAGEAEAAQAAGAKHLSVDDVRRLRPRFRSGRVVLTHLSARARADLADAPIAGCEVATDGASFRIGD